MAYTTAKKVFLSMERYDIAEESFTPVSNGDTLTLANSYPVNNTVTLTVDGTEQTEGTDFTVNYDDLTIDYSGSDSGDATVRYGYAPYADSAVQQSISAAEEYIDDYTNTTYDGTASVTNEVYDTVGSYNKVYPFVNRPVRTVTSVELNRPDPGESNPAYKELSEGLDGDYTTYKRLGIRFTSNGDGPENNARELRVSYSYGYEDVPADLEKAATEMVVDDLVRGTVSGAMVDGRDNFDPQTVDVNRMQYMEVLDRYRIQRMENVVNLADQGSTF